MSLRDRLLSLAAFLPAFEAPGFVFGAWAGGERQPDGRITMPYYDIGETAQAFVSAAYTDEWVTPTFDWPAWAGSTEFERFDRDPAAIASASSDQLARLLTVYIRSERFGDGNLEAAFKRGVLTAILRRAAALAAEEPADAPGDLGRSARG